MMNSAAEQELTKFKVLRNAAPVCHKSILIVSRPAGSSATPRKMRRGRSLFRNKSIAADTSHSMLIAIFVEHSTRSGHRTIISRSNARELLLLRFDGRS
jgi:hypothetical protein